VVETNRPKEGGVHSPRKLLPLIGSIGAVALALAAPGLVQAYPIMPDGEPIHVAGEAGRLPSVQRSYSTMPPEGVDGVPVVEPTETVFHPAHETTAKASESGWSGVAPVVAVSILVALAVLAATHIVNRQLRRSTTTRRIGG
jgi:hypothetical protein